MAQKNDSLALALALAVTLGILGSVGWWLFNRLGPNPSSRLAPIGSTQGTSTQGDDLAITNSPTLASVSDIPQGSFRYGGSTTWATIRAQVDRSIQVVHPGFQLTYTHPAQKRASTGSGIAMLLDGQLDFAQASRPLTSEEQATAQQRGIKLKQIAVAIDAIAIAINPDLKVPGLTLDQLRQIYSGGPSNWRSFGGPDQPIVPLLRQGSGSIDILLPKGQRPGPRTREIASTTEALRQIANNPGALYFTSAPEVVPQCTVATLAIGATPASYISVTQQPPIDPQSCPNQRNQINITAIQTGSYPLTRGLYVIIKDDGSPAQKAGEAYARLLLSVQGQDLISQAGFVRVR
jgi:phosphate transport system substrate-binding protein